VDAGDERAGLTSAAAAHRLELDGPNRLPPPPRRSAARELAEQLVHFFAVMLWVAAALALAAGLPQLGIAIAAVIVLNALFAYAQERRADRAAERLRALLPLNVRVRRDGTVVEVHADDVVVGDVLVLDAGDRIPADAEIIAAEALQLDRSLLTGESEPVAVTDGVLHAGTFVVEGQADARITATGAHTRLAEIARLTTTTVKPDSPLTAELRRVVRTISAIAVGVGSAFLVISVVVGTDLEDAFVFAIGVTVALVPEALLPTVTLSLAWGAEHMARRGVLVRDLEAVETLGSTTFVCTDKTGTLTLNQMTVVAAWTPAGGARTELPGWEPAATVEIDDGARAAVVSLASTGVRCSTGFVAATATGWRAVGDPMEAAIDTFARRLGVDTEALRRDMRPAARFPFDPRRRRMSLVSAGEVLVKGAPDAVLPRCADPGAADAAVAAFTERGLRVLAVGRRVAGEHVPATADDAERDLDLLGLVAMEDPPRRDARESIERCRHAGIRVAMITGDHPATARAIADEVGLRHDGAPVLVGDDLPADEQVLGALIDRDGVVVARVSPEDKLRIAAALRARGHVVAMTGDGVNDGPALHEAHIGIAMGASGTDVAREAADLVLLDDDFASIVAGIEQGRATFVNVRRFLTYHLTDNVAELTPFIVWALSGGRFPLALGVLQILALDLGTDTASAVALGAEPPAAHLLDGPPVSGRLLNRTVLRRAFGVLGPTEAVMGLLAFCAVFVASGWRPGDTFPTGDTLAAASGATFMTVVLAQSANAFACRSSTRPLRRLAWRSNRLLPWAVAAELAFSLAALLIGPAAAVLDHANPPLAGWAVAVAAAGAVLVVDELDKRHRGERRARRARREGRLAGPPFP
jgi:magnesium-transporting ATPase (P-type)